MANKKILENAKFAPEYLDYNKWPTVNEVDFNNKDHERFLARKKAVELYLDGNLTNGEIEKLTKICTREINRYIHRCLETDENGLIWGYRALIPSKRTHAYIRKADTSASCSALTGAFEKLLDSHPKIRDLIHDLYLGRKSRKNAMIELRIKPKMIWRRFIEACRREGIDETMYPLNTIGLAKRSLERYLKKINCRFFHEAASRYGAEAERKVRSFGQNANHLPILCPFQTVEFDGHRIDALFAIEFQTPLGDKFTKIMDRFWILVIIDVATRAILGYYLSLSKEYSSIDVLACIRNAVIPWQPKQFTIPGLNYPKNGGFPSGVLANAQWAIWQEFKVDNGKANLSNIVTERLTRLIGCSINPGPVSHPEYRGFVERWFLWIEENGYHRLPSTTGSDVKDSRRKDPEKQAEKYHISLQHLEELTEVFIARYNGTAHGGLCNLSPLEVMRQRLERETINVIPEELRDKISFMTFQAERRQ